MTARIEPSLLGKMTERQVLRALQAARPAVARRGRPPLRPQRPDRLQAVASLLRSGLLEETAAPEADRRPARHPPPPRPRQRPGARRRHRRRPLPASSAPASTASCTTTPRSFATPDSYPRLLDALARHARALMDRDGVATLGVGLSLPGLVDYRSQRGVLSPNVPITDGQSPVARPGRAPRRRVPAAAGVARPLPGRAALRPGPRPRRLRHARRPHRRRPRRRLRRPAPDRPQRPGRRDRPRHRRARRPTLRLRQRRLPGDRRQRHARWPGASRRGSAGP